MLVCLNEEVMHGILARHEVVANVCKGADQPVEQPARGDGSANAYGGTAWSTPWRG